MTNLPDLWREFDRPLSTFGGFRPLLQQLGELMSDQGMTLPQTHVEEKDDHYVMSFDMPGLSKDNIDIEIQGNQLRVSGERRDERRYRKFERTLLLPDDVKSDSVEAQYEDGVLMLAIPKAESKRQRISIGEGKGTLLGKATEAKASQAGKSDKQQQQAKH
jgi:HSP20 family protein